jgi:hypothetical protein
MKRKVFIHRLLYFCRLPPDGEELHVTWVDSFTKGLDREMLK